MAEARHDGYICTTYLTSVVYKDLVNYRITGYGIMRYG